MINLQENNKGTFDFIFVDADKNNYLNYHKKVIELVKIGGLIGYDNTLWGGSVAAPPHAAMMDIIRSLQDYVIEFNKYIAKDLRIEICQLSVGDGITLCRRISWSLLCDHLFAWGIRIFIITIWVFDNKVMQCGVCYKNIISIFIIFDVMNNIRYECECSFSLFFSYSVILRVALLIAICI